MFTAVQGWGGSRAASPVPIAPSLPLPPMLPHSNHRSRPIAHPLAPAGTGTFGRVRLCHISDDAKNAQVSKVTAPKSGKTPTVPKYYALKIMKKLEVVRLKQVEHIRNEKEILMAINHPFLVTLYAVAQDKTNLYMLLEYIIGGELFTHLRKAGKFSNEHGRFYAAQITMGLQYLHEESGQVCDLPAPLPPPRSSGSVDPGSFGLFRRPAAARIANPLGSCARSPPFPFFAVVLRGALSTATSSRRTS